MITGTQDVGDLLLMNVNGLALFVLEAAALKKAPVTLEHGEIKAGLFVEKTVVFFVVLDRVRRDGPGERACHGNTAVGVGDLPVTTTARLLPDIAFGVTRLGSGERRRLRGRTLWKERQQHRRKYQDGPPGDASSDQNSIKHLSVIES